MQLLNKNNRLSLSKFGSLPKLLEYSEIDDVECVYWKDGIDEWF